MPNTATQLAFDQAIAHHRAGKLADAERIYREILAADPNHADALHHLGLIALQSGSDALAVDLIRQAIAIQPKLAAAYFNFGIALKQVGQITESADAYRAAIALNPGHAEAHNNLGIVLRELGQIDQAIAAYQKACDLRSNFAEAHNNLGVILFEKGDFQAAITSYQNAIARRPAYAEAYSNLGNALKATGEIDYAIGCYRTAIQLAPRYALAHNNLGNALKTTGKLDEAIASYQSAIALKPGFGDAYYNLGIALRDAGRLDDAIAAYQQAISIKPDSPEAWNNLGNALRDAGKMHEATDALRAAINIRPTYAEAYVNLGAALSDSQQLDEAVDVCGKAVTVRPDYAPAFGTLANALADKGLIADAIAAHRQAVKLDPHDALIASNYVFSLHYDPKYDEPAIAEELRWWNQQYAEPLAKSILPHTNDRTPDRMLRIGYVSPDFRDHVAGRQVLAMLEHHDRGQFEIFCYSHVSRPDAITARLKQLSFGWRDIFNFSDDNSARQIRDDRIDILVDLAVHSGNNRLLIFARKPAPVQVTYLGYAGSSGLAAIDYRLSDPWLDPADVNRSYYSEKIIRLPRTYWCYDPGSARSFSVAPAPALQNKFITFGCLNNFAKVSSASVILWGQILAAIPDSRLILHAPPGGHRESILQIFENSGVNRNRIEFVAKQPRDAYMQTYSRIDIALDPFPFGGGITTCAAKGMGTPVVTLAGKTSVGRGAASVLSVVGMKELIARSPAEYAEIATGLARDVDRLKEMRTALRDRMLGSALMDSAGFTRDLESAYRQMWLAWCVAGK